MYGQYLGNVMPAIADGTLLARCTRSTHTTVRTSVILVTIVTALTLTNTPLLTHRRVMHVIPTTSSVVALSVNPHH